MKSLNISRTTLIAVLNKKLESSEANAAWNIKAEVADKLARQRNRAAVAKAVKSLTPRSVDVYRSTKGGEAVVTVSFNVEESLLPAKIDDLVKKPVLSSGRVEEIQNTLRILDLVLDDVVNVSGFKNIAQYL